MKLIDFLLFDSELLFKIFAFFFKNLDFFIELIIFFLKLFEFAYKFLILIFLGENDFFISNEFIS